MCYHALVPWPLSSKSGVGVYEDRGVILTTGQPCLSLNPFPTLTTPIPVVWLAFLAENTAETGQMGTNCPWNGAFLTSSWPSWWSWTLPPSFPALSTSWGWFLPFTVSHFDLPGLRYCSRIHGVFQANSSFSYFPRASLISMIFPGVSKNITDQTISKSPF